MRRLAAQIRARLHAQPLSARSGPVGMEFGQSQLRMMQLQRGRDGRIAVSGYCRCGYPVDRARLFESTGGLRKLLRSAFREHALSGRQIVVAIPPEEVKIVPLAYPNSQKDDDQVITELLQKRIEGKLQDFVIDYLPIRSNPRDEEKLSLVMMAKRDRVVQILDRLWDAGLEVQALDVGPAAICRFFSLASGPGYADTALVINAGRDRSYLTMMSGRRLLFDQQVEFGETPLIRHLSRVLEIGEESCRGLLLNHGFSDQEATVGDTTPSTSLAPREIASTLREILKPLFLELAEEINRVLLFGASETRGDPVRRIYLLGAIAHWKGVDRILDELLDIPVLPINRDLGILGNRALNGDDSITDDFPPDMVIATGLALRGLDSDA